jgi:hypothetical protein
MHDEYVFFENRRQKHPCIPSSPDLETGDENQYRKKEWEEDSYTPSLCAWPDIATETLSSRKTCVLRPDISEPEDRNIHLLLSILREPDHMR